MLQTHSRQREAASQLLPFFQVLFLTIVFGVNFYLATEQTLADGTPYCRFFSDLPHHLDLARLGLGSAPVQSHPGLHYATSILHGLTGVSIEYSAVLILSLCATVTALLVYRIMSNSLRKDGYGEVGLIVMTGLTLTLSAIYVPFFNEDLYLGQGSANIWHNPTMTMMKPLSFAAFLLALAAFHRATIRKSWPWCLAAGLVLAASVVAKPSFAMVFVPALLIFGLLKRKTHYLVKAALVIAPSLPLLTVQYLAGFGVAAAQNGATASQLTQGGDSVVFDFLGVWSSYTPSVPVSLLLGLAFPLAVLGFRFRAALKNPALAMSWLMTLCGGLQFALLAETRRRAHGNFSWSYSIALSFLFVYSTIEYLKWLRPGQQRSLSENIALTTTSLLLSLHVVSGLFYTLRIVTGGSYRW